MNLARIVGRVVCTVKNETLTGRKLLLLQPVDERGIDHGKPFVAVDAVGAGAGENILYCTGKEASFAFLPDSVPTDATVVGIIDDVALLDDPERG